MRSLLAFSVLALSASLASAGLANRNPPDFTEKLDLLDQLVKATNDRWGTIGNSNACNGGNDCCTSSNRCGIAEGDCDSDSDCLEGLVCGAPGNCADIRVPDYVHFTVPNGDSFSATDACCQLDPALLSYFENDQV